MTDLDIMLKHFKRNGLEFRCETLPDDEGQFSGYTVLTTTWGYSIYNRDGFWIKHAADCLDDFVRNGDTYRPKLASREVV